MKNAILNTLTVLLGLLVGYEMILLVQAIEKWLSK